MHIHDSVTELIGRTPLLRVNNLIRQHHLQADLLVKLEGMNPAGSAKDRVGLNLILDAEARGILRPGGVIIEPTSGNTGVGLASAAAARGYRVILTMPDNMSAERIALLRAYGAQLVLTPGAQGMAGAIQEAERIARETPGSFVAGQFDNPANPEAHYRATGPEIWQDTDGRVDVFVAGVGTGGTITGAGRYLKEQNPHVRVVAVEPADSPVLSGGRPGPHGLMGIGAGFVPGALDTSVYDEIITVSTAEAYEGARALAAHEGVLAGITGGAALFAAMSLAEQASFRGKTIVALLPDTGERYLSTPLFAQPPAQREVSCGAVLFTRAGDGVRFLLVRSHEGVWGFPKGHMEAGETERETALREIREETGVDARLIDGFQTQLSYLLPTPNGFKRVVYFLAEYENQTPVYQAEELSALSLMDYETALSSLRYQGTKRVLREAWDFLRRQG